MGAKATFFLPPVSQEMENVRWKMAQCKTECGKELSERIRALGESLIWVKNR